MFTLINLLTALVMLIAVIFSFHMGKRAGINEIILNGIILGTLEDDNVKIKFKDKDEDE